MKDESKTALFFYPGGEQKESSFILHPSSFILFEEEAKR
jgi:hypothetical protein